MSEFRITRRSVLKTGVASAAFLAAPAIISSKALASSGELKIVDYDLKQRPVYEEFGKATGIKVTLIPITNDDEMFAQVKLAAGSGNGADLAFPAITNLPLWYSNGFLEGFDPGKLDMASLLPGMPGTKEGDAAYKDGKLIFACSLWGGEAMGYAADVPGHAYGEASLADILDPQFNGQVTVRAHSALAAIGRVLDAQGKLPKPFLDSYKDEAVMKANYDVIIAEAIKHKGNIGQFWSNDSEGQGAFTANGCRVGLIWESIGRVVQDHGVRYLAPKEGAFGWNQGFVLLKNAANADAAHELVKYLSAPEHSAKWASALEGLPSAKGAVELMDEKSKAFTAAAYPGDAVSKIWWWPPQEAWFIKLRSEYADKWRAA